MELHNTHAVLKVQNLGNVNSLAAPVGGVGVRTKKEGNVIVLLGGIQVENHLLGTEKKCISVNACITHEGQLT